MEKLIANFGSKVFDNNKMKNMLPSPTYKKWIETINKNDSLDRETADVIAHSMKEWAISEGCTHFTHWFLPLTGSTAEKYESFIDKDHDTKEVITKFSGKNLIKGEPDASSFPNGGLRATFEARGYTYWDCTSNAFIKDNILYIPTIFVSYNGEALDAKLPLLNSIDLVSKAATRIINAFGDKQVTSVMPVVGLEQEYFLVDKEDYIKRQDLRFTGKTLLGSLPPVSKELENHYYGAIPNRVKNFMDDVNSKLWNLGIYAKSEHNEVAPGQFELVPIFENSSVSCDQNQLIMEILKKTALKHDLVCLLHEKPFKGVNGSGKHNNISLITNTGVNVFDPGKNPHENIQFLTFVCAFIKAVDEHSDLIRLFSSCPGNDYRLGADEAPPAIISIFLGERIEQVLNQLSLDKPKTYEKSSLKDFGLSTLSYIPRDNSDRNRTSPIAFTGNKFEIRLLGSSMNASYLNMTINTILAEALNEIADEIESHKYRQDIRKSALDICVDIISKHKRVLFSGDGYNQNWVEEAKKRGLLNIKTFNDAINYVKDNDSLDVFVNNKILTKKELIARINVLSENNYNVKRTELSTLIEMMKNTIYPIVNKNIYLYSKSNEFMPEYIKNLVIKLKDFVDSSYSDIVNIENIIDEANNEKDIYKKNEILCKAFVYSAEIRKKYDIIEKYLDIDTLNYPTYDNLFFRIEN